VRASVVATKSKKKKRQKKHKKHKHKENGRKKPKHDDFASSIKLLKTF
jgi:hypothetical protein